VNVYRGSSAVSTSRIGRGTLNRVNPTAVTGSGSIVSFAVSPGDRVERGDLLFETLEGSFDGLYMSGSDIAAGVSGTISRIDAQAGGAVQKGSVVAVIYPESAMRIEAQVAEADLASIAEGDPVSIELLWNQDEEVSYEGRVAMISAIANESAGGDDSGVTYTVYVDFTPDENTRYGMSAIVTTLEDETEPEEADMPEEAEETEPEAEPEGEAADFRRGERPEGFDPENMPEGFEPGSRPEDGFPGEEGED